MGVAQIPNLPAAIALAGNEPFEIVQAGVSKRATPLLFAQYIANAQALAVITVDPPLQLLGNVLSLLTVPVNIGGTNATTTVGAAVNLSTAYVVEDLAALKALTSYPSSVITQCREDQGDQGGGRWVFRTGNQSTNVTNDPQSAWWAAPDSTPSGTAGAWERQFKGPLNAVWGGMSTDIADNSAIYTALYATAKTAFIPLYVPSGHYDFTDQVALDATTASREAIPVIGDGKRMTVFNFGTTASPQHRVYATNGPAGMFYGGFFGIGATGTIDGVVMQLGAADLSDFWNSFDYDVYVGNGSTGSSAVALQMNNHFDTTVDFVVNCGGVSQGIAFDINQCQFTRFEGSAGNALKLYNLRNVAAGNVFLACDAEVGGTGWTFNDNGCTDNVIIAGIAANLSYVGDGIAGARNRFVQQAQGTITTARLNGTTGIVDDRASGTTGVNTSNLVYSAGPTFTGVTNFDQITAVGPVTVDAGNAFHWTGRSWLYSPADGYLSLLNNATTGGVIFNGSADGVLILRNFANSANATLESAAHLIVSASASSLLVGPTAGGTNPVLQVDSSTGSQAAGLKLTGAVAAGTVALQVLSSGADASLSIAAKGTGTLSTPSSFSVTAGTMQFMGTAGGTADALTATPTPAISAYTTNAVYFVRATATNATTTPTLNISGLGAKTIVKRAATALAAGDIVNGMGLLFFYDGTNMQLLNPVVN